MPLTRCPDDVSIDILAYLSLNTIVALTLVQKAWKTFIETYEEHIYHNAAIFDGLVLSSTTSLAEEKWALGSSLWIDGWKAFCRLRIDIERNWAGLGSSSMDKISTTGNSVVYRKAIPGTDRAIVSSMSRGIAVYDENGTVWALPDYYIPQPTYFVYDAGHLVFQRAGSNIIDIWHDGSHHTWLPISLAFLPSPEQGGAHTTSSVNYFPGYFHPAAALPAPSERINTIKLLYPTLVVATSSAVHIWDIQAANSICTLGTQNIADLEMRYQGVEISQELIVAFDSEQIRFFSRHDGLFLSFLSRSISISARGAQLLPPPNHATPSQWPDRVLLQQILFRKRRQWSSSRGRFTHVGVSPCGMTLCILSSKLRMLIVNDIQRVIKEDLPISDAAVDVKIAGKYGSFNSLTVTRDRIAIGTNGTGTLIITLDRSSSVHGPRPHNTVRFCKSPELGMHPVQLRASMAYCSMRNLEFAGTKLFFTDDPGAHIVTPAGRPAEEAESQGVDDGASEASDDIPSLQSISDSSSSGEDADESDHGDDGDDTWLDLDHEKERLGVGAHIVTPAGRPAEDAESQGIDDGASEASDDIPSLQTISDSSGRSEDADESDHDDGGDDTWLDLDHEKERLGVDGNAADLNTPDIPSQESEGDTTSRVEEEDEVDPIDTLPISSDAAADAPTAGGPPNILQIRASLDDLFQHIQNLQLEMRRDRSCVFVIDVAPR